MKRILAIALTVVCIMVVSISTDQSIYGATNTNHLSLNNKVDDLIEVALSQKDQKASDFKFKADWCTLFVCWAAKTAGLNDGKIFPTKSYGNPRDLSIWYVKNKTGIYYYFRDSFYKRLSNPIFKISDFSNMVKADRNSFEPKEGDLILFSWNTDPKTNKWSHIGIVYKVDGDNIHYIDGNYSEKVCVHSKNYSNKNKKPSVDCAIYKNNEYIVGYLRPNYTTPLPAVPQQPPSTPKKTRTTTLDVTDMETTTNESEGWSWNRETKTLILNGVNIDVKNPDAQQSAINIGAATIILNGTNTIKCTVELANTLAYGIRTNSGELIFDGDGTLTVMAENSRAPSYAINSTFGRITINGGSITAIGGDTNDRSAGIFAYGLTMNGGTLIATGGKTEKDCSNGVYLYTEDLIINGGTLHAIGGSSAYDSVLATAGVCVYRHLSTHGDIILNNAKIITPSGGYVGVTDGDYTNATIFDPTNPNKAAKEVLIQGGK